MPAKAMLGDYPHRVGGHCGSGAMRDLLHWQGLGWDGPPEEGLVFALGGALALSYIRSDALVPPLYLVGRGADFEVDLPRRLGGAVEMLATDDAALGWEWVRSELDEGRPCLVWGDIAELPYLRVSLAMSRHDIVIVGYDEEASVAYVVDNDRADIQEVPLASLARARASTAFPQPTRHCTFRLQWPEELPDLAGAAADAFYRSAENMRDPLGRAIATQADALLAGDGLAAAELFATDVISWVDTEPEDLAVLLFSLGAFIEKAGTGGGLFRQLLAQGAADVATLTGDGATAELAAVAARASRTWTAVAKAAIQPGSDPRDRLEDVVRIAQSIPETESELATALEKAAESLAPARLG